MGSGIAGAISLVIEPWQGHHYKGSYFSSGFFDNFDMVESKQGKQYEIKADILINNYRSLRLDFHSLIEEYTEFISGWCVEFVG